MLRLLIAIALIVPLGCQLPRSDFFKDAVLASPGFKITCDGASADACTDKKEHCDVLVPIDDENKIKPFCENPDNEDVLWLCLMTCGMCCLDPRYACEDKTDPRYDCAKFKQLGLCDSTAELTHDIAIHDCALTCAKCNESVPVNCKDSESIYVCGFYKEAGYCDKYQYHEQMVHECPFTCGFCDEVPVATSTGKGGGTSARTTSAGGTTVPTTSVCMDSATDCGKNISLCNDPHWHEIMVNRCPATCGFCSLAPVGPTVCVDNNPNCFMWAQQGFCTSSYYTDAQRKQYCPKTCNLC